MAAATAAELNGPTGIALDSAGDLDIADTGNNVIRRVVSGVITTVVGDGTVGLQRRRRAGRRRGAERARRRRRGFRRRHLRR